MVWFKREKGIGNKREGLFLREVVGES